ncbi:MAG TPA: hypothetical protein VI358_15305 [Pseudolabrys sp.]
MPALLYGIGVFALFAGLVMIGFGVPINEFSFGNTLIGAGTTAGIGGLIIIGLGVVAGQMRRVAEALTVQSSARLGQPIEGFEDSGPSRPIPPQGHIPFPPRSRSEAHMGDLDAIPPPAAIPAEEPFAPTLRNPDESAVTVEDEISLSPHYPGAATAPAGSHLPGSARPSEAPAHGRSSGVEDKTREAMPGWRSLEPPAPPAGSPQARPIHSANFDAMWPAEAKPSKAPVAGEPRPEARPDVPSRHDLAAPPKRAEPETQKPRTAAILKSGVVDGMGYTLYVDGSIEAELPQGTIRFASINELRSHLAKNS